MRRHIGLLSCLARWCPCHAISNNKAVTRCCKQVRAMLLEHPVLTAISQINCHIVVCNLVLRLARLALNLWSSCLGICSAEMADGHRLVLGHLLLTVNYLGWVAGITQNGWRHCFLFFSLLWLYISAYTWGDHLSQWKSRQHFRQKFEGRSTCHFTQHYFQSRNSLHGQINTAEVKDIPDSLAG